MENQDSSTVLAPSEGDQENFTNISALKENIVNEPSTDPEVIFSIIEDAFPNQENIRQYALPQALQWIGTRFFAIWVWPIVGINKLRQFIKGLDFIQPYNQNDNNSYEVRDTETVYTMTKDAFSGKGGIKFFGIRFMSIWVFPMAITGAVMEFLFVGPIKGTNPFG